VQLTTHATRAFRDLRPDVLGDRLEVGAKIQETICVRSRVSPSLPRHALGEGARRAGHVFDPHDMGSHATVRVRLGVVALASAAALGASGAASAQVPDLPDTPPIPTLPDLPDLPDVPVVVPDVPDVPASPGVTGTESQSGSTQGDGSSVASSGSSSPSGSAASRARAGSGSNGTYTRFDRLPRRYERLLERILAGRDVDANLRRLERLLASTPPRLRARILRLVRREIAALEQGRITPEERRRIKRLHRVEDLFAAPGAATATAAATPVSAAASSASGDAAGATSGSQSGVASAAVISDPRRGAEPPASADSAHGILGLPSPAEGIMFGTFVLVLAAVLLAFVAMPTRAVPVGVRQRVQRSGSDLAALGLAALAAAILVLLVVAVS
jgi:hypothetical protein